MTRSLEKKIHDAAQSIEPSQEFSQKLWKEIKSSPQAAPKAQRTPRWRWIPVTITAMLVITLMVISPQKVWASLIGLFDFLPGIGLVQDDETTLYLQEPVSLEQDGVVLTIDQIVSDANQTVVSYQIDNLPAEYRYCSYSINRLLLPDGKNLLPTGGGTSNEGGIVKAHIQFFALPEGVTQATLFSSIDPDNPDASRCSAPHEWKVDFNLSTTKPDNVELLPVVESTAENTGESIDADVKISIDKSVTLDDGYILYGNSELSNPYWTDAFLDFQTMTAQDANGKEIPIEPEDILKPDPDGDNSQNAFAIKVSTKDFTAPLTLHIKKLEIITLYAVKFPVFTFDAGSDPQVGQSWEINQEVDVDGIKINFEKVEVIQESSDQGRDEDLEKGYAITVKESSALDFHGSYFCEGQGEGVPDYGTADNKTFSYYYSGGLPYGSVTCSIYDAFFSLPGSWEIEWQPPENEG